MGGRKLNTYVHVVELDGEGRSATFGPADDLPEWAIAAISNPDVWDGRPADQAPAVALAGDSTPPVRPAGIPPRGGAGSGAPAWREYAASKGVEVAADASREDCITALDAAGVPTGPTE